MKGIALLLLTVFTLNSHAFNYGKFKLKVSDEFSECVEITFLLNSKGEVEMLENDYYYSISTSTYFDETTLYIRSGGDEDFVKAVYNLKDNEIVINCAAWIDGPNEVLSILGKNSMTLLRWNKVSKSYQKLEESDFNRKECEESLISGYEEFEQF